MGPERRSEVESGSAVSSPIRLVGTGLAAGVVCIVVTIVAAASVTSVLVDSTVDVGTIGAVGVVAFPTGLALGVRYPEQWPWPALVAGGLTGVFLFLRGLLFLAQGNPISYPLLFGPAGATVALGGALGGGWIGARPYVARRLSPPQLSALARAGLAVAGGWTAIELLFGLGLASTVGRTLDNTFAGSLVATVVGFPMAALFAVRYGRRVGMGRDDWGYRTTGRTVRLGLGLGIVTAVAVQGTGRIVVAVGGADAAIATFGFLLADLEAGVWVLLLFAIAHGIVAPVAEELAWRGVVQSALVEAQGRVLGITVTALLFTAKHAVLDASLARIPSVLLLAVVLGYVRDRWGTTASTVVHATVNLASVLGLAVLVYG